jgi:hypothetical protein
MATPFSFQSLNFNNIPGREIEANRRYTAGLEGMFKSIGEGAKDIASTYMSEEERKQREAEDKKKWDNMIAQQEYQKEQNRLNKEYQASRDAVADAQYNNEWNVKQEERRLEAGKRMNEHSALENYREGLKKSYTPEFLKKYGPSAQAELEAALAATTLAESMAAGSRLGQMKFQQDVLDFQREQTQADREREKMTKDADDRASQVYDWAARNNIDVGRNFVLPNGTDALKARREELVRMRDFLNETQKHSYNSRILVSDINANIDAIDRKINYKKPKSNTDKALEAYNK